jgi:hypothetical protein
MTRNAHRQERSPGLLAMLFRLVMSVILLLAAATWLTIRLAFALSIGVLVGVARASEQSVKKPRN